MQWNHGRKTKYLLGEINPNEWPYEWTLQGGQDLT